MSQKPKHLKKWDLKRELNSTTKKLGTLLSYFQQWIDPANRESIRKQDLKNIKDQIDLTYIKRTFYPTTE